MMLVKISNSICILMPLEFRVLLRVSSRNRDLPGQSRSSR